MTRSFIYSISFHKDKQVTDYVSGFDGVKDSFVKPAKVDQKGLVSQTAGKSAEYSEAEVVALSGSTKIFGEEVEEYVPTVPRTINGFHAENNATPPPRLQPVIATLLISILGSSARTSSAL